MLTGGQGSVGGSAAQHVHLPVRMRSGEGGDGTELRRRAGEGLQRVRSAQPLLGQELVEHRRHGRERVHLEPEPRHRDPSCHTEISRAVRRTAIITYCITRGIQSTLTRLTTCRRGL